MTFNATFDRYIEVKYRSVIIFLCVPRPSCP